jgi:hypothetical protein
MEDLLREVVTFVQLRKKGDDMLVKLFYRYEKSVVFFKNDPLYVIDGVMNTSTKDFMNLRPEDLLSIKIINNPNKLSQLGDLGANGIVFVESKKRNLSRNFERNIFPVTGLSSPRLFDSKNEIFNARKSNIPDLRPTLIWLPFIKVNENGIATIKLMLSDDIGAMNVNIQGTTNDGIFFSANNAFRVEPNLDRR